MTTNATVAGTADTDRRTSDICVAFAERYRAAYEAASRMENWGRRLIWVAVPAALLGIFMVFRNFDSNDTAGLAPGLGLAFLVAPALAWGSGTARRRAAFLRATVDAALFVAPGLTDNEKLKIAFFRYR